jgi:hypothetical protein
MNFFRDFNVTVESALCLDLLLRHGGLENAVLDSLARLPSSSFFFLSERSLLWRRIPAESGRALLVGAKPTAAVLARVNVGNSTSVTVRITVAAAVRILSPVSLTVHVASWERMGLGEIQGIASDEYAPRDCVYCPLEDQDPRCCVLPTLRPAIIQAISRRYPFVNISRQRLEHQRNAEKAAEDASSAMTVLSPIYRSMKGAFATSPVDSVVWCILSYPPLDDAGDEDLPENGGEDSQVIFIAPSDLLVRRCADYTANIPPAHRSAVETTLLAFLDAMDSLPLSAEGAVLRQCPTVPLWHTDAGLMPALCSAATVPCGVSEPCWREPPPAVEQAISPFPLKKASGAKRPAKRGRADIG